MRAIRAYTPLLVLASYLVSPSDIIPDFMPGIGLLDHVVPAAMALRWFGRGVSRQRLDALWASTPEDLA